MKWRTMTRMTTTTTTLMTIVSQCDGANFIQKEKYLRNIKIVITDISICRASMELMLNVIKKKKELSNIYPTIQIFDKNNN